MMMRRWITALAMLGMAGAGLAAAAPAASAAAPACLVVDTNANTSYTSLQAAVNTAAAGDTLFVKGTCTGTTEVGKNLTISGHSASGTKTATLDGGRQPGSVLTIDSGLTVTLNTLIITGGEGDRGGDGGGISNAGTVTLNDSTITRNGTVQGGGISSVGTVTMNDSTITGNTAQGAGGGIFSEAGTVTLNGSSTITGNTAARGSGGGIYNAPGSTVTMNDSATITGNTAGSDGGGIENESESATVTMNGSSTITGNTAGDGGGIFNDCGGQLNGGVDGVNVFNNKPDNIVNDCA